MRLRGSRMPWSRRSGRCGVTEVIIDGGELPEEVFSDAARRCAEWVNLHVNVAGVHAIGQWVAIRLSDGGSDGNLYPTKVDAVRHQLNEFWCAYVCIPPGGMPVRDAEVYLRTMRQLYDNGYRLADPDKHVVMRS